MAGSTESDAAGRGARKREERRQRDDRAAEIRRWTRPGVLIFFAMVLVALGGWLLVIREARRIPREEATLGGLYLRMDSARWVLDQMDHGETYVKPASMMPDMPDFGKQRVTLDLTFVNRSKSTQVYDGSEFFLVPEIGEDVPPIGAQIGSAPVGPGQALNTALHFDFDTRAPHGRLRVEWRRDGKSAYLPIPEPPEHYHLRPRGGEVALPPDARLLLPIGVAERGKGKYDGVFGCVACHGDPKVPESNIIGPHLGQIALTAAGRVEGLPPEQYIYQSLLSPNSFIAPECKDGPCEEPSAMPEYASLMNLEDFADLLAYLLEQRG